MNGAQLCVFSAALIDRMNSWVACPRPRALFVLITTAALAVGALGSVQPHSRAREDSLLALAQRALENEALSGLGNLEQRALAAPDADASRKEERLVLHLKSGGIRAYDNRPECYSEAQEAKCQKYFLVVHASSRGDFVIAKLYYESLEFLVVNDATGEETTLRGLPAFSPSGGYLLVLLSNDAQIGFAVQVWSREGHRFVLTWTGTPYTDGIYTTYKLTRWRSDTTIEVEATTDFVPPKPSSVHHFEVHRGAAGWDVVRSR